jgi:SRSO17 transposase
MIARAIAAHVPFGWVADDSVYGLPSASQQAVISRL